MTWTPEGGGAPVSAERRIGFRVVSIVTADDSVPSALAGVDGSGNMTLRWRVNGANILARGADVIPMEGLEGRQSAQSYRALVASCAAAHFNVLRVDGIDLIFPSVFYEACDSAGLLVYHDMQYSQGNPEPLANDEERAELLHTARKLAHHASVAVYDGCNECGGRGIYASFVMTTVAGEDPSRPPWPTSPSNGWLSGVDRLTSLPNGSPLGLQPTLPAPRLWRRGDAAAGNCTYVADVDLCTTAPECVAEPHPEVVDAAACCDACAAAGATNCGASVFYDSLCWFKFPNATLLVSAPGRVVCWPKSRPVPPVPTPGPMPTLGSREQHGPYQHVRNYSHGATR